MQLFLETEKVKKFSFVKIFYCLVGTFLLWTFLLVAYECFSRKPLERVLETSFSVETEQALKYRTSVFEPVSELVEGTQNVSDEFNSYIGTRCKELGFDMRKFVRLQEFLCLGYVNSDRTGAFLLRDGDKSLIPLVISRAVELNYEGVLREDILSFEALVSFLLREGVPNRISIDVGMVHYVYGSEVDAETKSNLLNYLEEV